MDCGDGVIRAVGVAVGVVRVVGVGVGVGVGVVEGLGVKLLGGEMANGTWGLAKM